MNRPPKLIKVSQLQLLRSPDNPPGLARDSVIGPRQPRTQALSLYDAIATNEQMHSFYVNRAKRTIHMPARL